MLHLVNSLLIILILANKYYNLKKKERIKMSDSIRISEKHGVNPTIPVCFWCGKDKNEVAFLGKLKEDAEAPHRAILNYEPCDECKEFITQGVQLIGTSLEPIMNNMPPITMMEGPGEKEETPLYPTSTFVVVQESFIREFLEEESPEFVEDVIAKRALLLPQEIVTMIIEKSRKTDEPVQDVEDDEDYPEDIQDK